MGMVGGRLARCRACGFVLPRPRAPSERTSETGLGDIPSIAPDGVLRGKYRLIERLGEGAHGVSYLAEHEYLSHLCVVKVLGSRPGEVSDAAIRRLRNEARAGFRVHDPNVVRVLDCDVVDGVWYFVMECIDGVNLATLLEHQQRVSWHQAVRIGIDAALGLAAIHRDGLLHQDVKPGNLILGADGLVRVADLGVAGLLPARQQLADVGSPAMEGTLAYTAPELFQPDGVPGPQTDLYSLGVTLYQLLTGRLPHDSSQVFRRLIDLQCRPVSWPSEGCEDVPEWLVKVVLKLLSIEHEMRFETANALIEQLRTPTAKPVKPRPVVQTDTLQPRGIGVLPFHNEAEIPDDDWMGYAVANSLSRALSETPGVYVADQDGLVAMVERVEGKEGQSEAERLLEAGRMLGAGTVIVGKFVRQGGQVRITAEAHRNVSTGPERVAQVEGELVNLADLERELFTQLAGSLELERYTPREPQGASLSPTVAAQERFVLGKQAFLRGDYEQAIALAEEASSQDPDFTEVIGFLGVCFARLGRYEDAEAQHRKQEIRARETGDARRQIEALANLGVMYYFRGEYEDAEAHYTRAARLAEQRDLAAESAQICNNLGFVLFRRGRLAAAEEAFSRAIETHRAYGGLTSLVGPYNGMGNVLAEQERYEEARPFYRRALALAAETGDRASVGTTHMHLGRCAAKQGRFADAQHEFTMALNALEETRFWNGLARAYEYIGEMNLQLGNTDEAVRCADKRIELARHHSNARMEAAAWNQKAESLRQAGREEEAVACLAHAQADKTGGLSP